MTSNAGVAHSMVQYTHQLVGSHLQYTYRKGRKKASVLTRFMSTWLKLEIFGRRESQWRQCYSPWSAVDVGRLS